MLRPGTWLYGQCPICERMTIIETRHLSPLQITTLLQEVAPVPGAPLTYYFTCGQHTLADVHLLYHPDLKGRKPCAAPRRRLF